MTEGKIRLGEEIKLRRKAKGWDQSQLARKVGATATTVGRWENAKTTPRPHHIKSLKRELGFTEDDFLQAFGVRTPLPVKNEQYSALSFASAAERLGSFEALDEAQRKIVSEWPLPAEPEEYGTDEKWIELFHLSPESGGVVVHNNDAIVGYWQSLAVCDGMYEKILRGENVNNVISPEDIVILMSPGVYKMYFVDLFLRKFHTNIVTRKLLIQDFLKFLREAAEEGIFFDRIVANITGIDVKRQCEGLGFQHVTYHDVHQYYDRDRSKVAAEIFELVIGPDAERLFSHDSKLSNMYEAKGLLTSKAEG